MKQNRIDQRWSTFRRVFLWTLAAFALLWSLRVDAAPTDDPSPGASSPPEQSMSSEPVLPPMPHGEAAAPVAESAPPVSGPQYGSSVTHFPNDNWTVTIAPRSSHSDDLGMASRYNEVYESVPYRRAEYLANPGYRHETTMELLFGQLRPMTKVSSYTPQTIALPQYTPYKPYRATQTDLFHQWRPSLLAPYSWNFPVTPYYPTMPLLY
ncbi:MAG: hypothetical protein ACK5Q5_21785 [Planctomycetaceae bacterium]